MLYRMNLKTLMVAAAVTALSVSAVNAAARGYTDIYVIGDSLSDQGNLFYATQQSTGNGVPANDHYHGGRFANGEIYADVLAERMGLRLTASSQGGNNFAYGGARTEYNVVEADATKPFPVSLLQQGGVFPEDAFPWTINGQRAAFTARNVVNADGLYVVFAGSNDMADLINMVAIGAVNPAFPAVDPAAVIAKVLHDIDAAIAAAVAAGARDVLVPNLPNFGVVPRITRSGPAVAALATGLSQQYNLAFDAMIAGWSGRVNIIPVDVYSLLTEVVSNPAAYGFSNASAPCYSGFVAPGGPDVTACATPDSYVFWDEEHPTAAFHAFLANRLHFAAMLDILDDIGARLQSLTASPGVSRSLGSKIDAARQKLTDANASNDFAAGVKLSAFILAVEAQLRKGSLAEADALVLVERAEKVSFLVNALP